MPTDLSGTPTSLGIGTYNTSVDGPSGLGFNEAMAQIDALIVATRADVATRAKVTTSPLGSGPPASPSDGDIWIATGVDGNGTRWQFQYNAGSASAYKWEFMGGAAVVVNFDADETTTSTAFTDLATVGPSFTLVRGGDYEIIAGAGMYASAFTTSFGLYVVPNSLATAAQAGESDGASTNQLQTKQSRPVRSLGLAAGFVAKAQYAVAASSTTGHFRDRWLRVTPVRVA